MSLADGFLQPRSQQPGQPSLSHKHSKILKKDLSGVPRSRKPGQPGQPGSYKEAISRASFCAINYTLGFREF